MKFLVILIVALSVTTGNWRVAAADCVACGDANGDGMYTVADIAYITAFLYAGGPAAGGMRGYRRV